MQKRIGQIFSFLLLVAILLLNGLPREFIHEFSGHTDTVDEKHHGGLSFESEHHHCDFAQQCLPEYIQPTAFFALKQYPTFHSILSIDILEYHKTERQFFISLRGPPVA